MKTNKNKGIVITGGNLHAQQIAIGENAKNVLSTIAKVDERNSELVKIKEQLTLLVEAIEKNKESLKNSGELLDSTDTVAKEVLKEKPNKITIDAVLNGIKNGAKTVKEILPIVNVLKTLIIGFL
ncbi:hypothetical protein OKW21_005817 [Catalinimonas alkaloidigena]|uniref:hypothetical protein n=1 Tax=Catalinimonas alkaloidigena TaxID=1075417 RepID=UPI00240671C4|nr:hypothetical protein [Catalinimonas alkaloidigena]MDF9800554.1 hypothetical protein [Catalinimonas alkaloidigena]